MTVRIQRGDLTATELSPDDALRLAEELLRAVREVRSKAARGWETCSAGHVLEGVDAQFETLPVKHHFMVVELHPKELT